MMTPIKSFPRLCRTVRPAPQAGCFVSRLSVSCESQIALRHRAFGTVALAPSSVLLNRHYPGRAGPSRPSSSRPSGGSWTAIASLAECSPPPRSCSICREFAPGLLSLASGSLYLRPPCIPILAQFLDQPLGACHIGLSSTQFPRHLDQFG